MFSLGGGGVACSHLTDLKSYWMDFWISLSLSLFLSSFFPFYTHALELLTSAAKPCCHGFMSDSIRLIFCHENDQVNSSGDANLLTSMEMVCCKNIKSSVPSFDSNISKSPSLTLLWIVQWEFQKASSGCEIKSYLISNIKILTDVN